MKRLLIFVKWPRPGRVKTRLAEQLGDEPAASLYEACLRDVVARAARGPAPLELWYEDEPGAADYFQREFAHVRCAAQNAGTLGDKLEHAFQSAFGDGVLRAVVIGSDSPTFPDGTIARAFDDLDEVDAVVGPAHDGGYYLIGLRASAWPGAAHAFRGIAWSTADVFVTTMERIAEAALDARVLPGWYDIDRVSDLDAARADLDPDSNLARWFLEQRPAADA